MDFVSDDPAVAGTMIMTWEVVAAEGGTRVDITAADVPDGISADDHPVGLASSLANLATYVEAEPELGCGARRARQTWVPQVAWAQPELDVTTTTATKPEAKLG